MNELAWDEIIIGILSLLSVVAGTVIQKQRHPVPAAVVPKESLEKEHTKLYSQDDLINVIVNLNTDNRNLRKRLKDK